LIIPILEYLLALDGNIMQLGALELGMILSFAVFAFDVAVVSDFLLVFIENTSVEVVIQFVLFQEVEECLEI
jgi:hypothetical protein